MHANNHGVSVMELFNCVYAIGKKNHIYKITTIDSRVIIFFIKFIIQINVKLGCVPTHGVIECEVVGLMLGVST